MMQHRHRVPTIFNIYMLDVICCSLGCVVLLWQVAHQEAEEQTANAQTEALSAKQHLEEYQKANAAFLSAVNDVSKLQILLDLLQQKHSNLSQRLVLTEKEREEARHLALRRQDEIDKGRTALAFSEERIKKLEDDIDKNRKLLALGEERLKKLDIEMTKLLASRAETNAALTEQKKINLNLLDKIALAEKRMSALKNDMAGKQIEIDATTKKYEEQVVLVKLSEENAQKLQKLLDSVRIDSKDTQAKLKLTELQIKVRDQELERLRDDLKNLLASREKLGKELTAGSKELLDMKGLLAALAAERDRWKEKQIAGAKELTSANVEKNKLDQRVRDLQAEVEQRFAGVPLTGESVVFLIDVSGSMVMKDMKTDDPDKWPFLCDTLMQLMRSIPTMKRFQVILFSDKTTYLFGERDYWLKYSGPETAKTTRDALRKFAVGGNTNMHDGFEEAFRYRKMGLDTIYLFSDGLPNAGPGLPDSIRKPTEEQLNLHLGKFVRGKLLSTWNPPAKDAVRINSIGFYFESPDVGAFLWAMSREHRGSFVGLR